MAVKKFVIILDALKAEKKEVFEKVLNRQIYSSKVFPPFSFEPDASYLCGQYPFESNAGLKFWKKENKKRNFFLQFLKYLPNRPRNFRKVINKILSLMNLNVLKEYQNNFACIPFRLLPHFELSQSKNLFTKNSGHTAPTIFDLLEEDYFYIGVPNSSGQLDIVKNSLSQDIIDSYNSIFIYISDLDSTGHRYGGTSKEYDKKLIEILMYLKNMIEMAYKNENKVEFLIFGDHGMSNIYNYVNIEEILKTIPVILGKDYLCFLDSTMARFWFFNERAKELITKKLDSINYGGWISEDQKNEYKINYTHTRYGEKIWWAHDHTIISPNYWQGEKKLKGMHGYRKESKDNATAYYSNMNFNTSKSIDMVEINKLLKNFLVKK